MLVNTGTGMTWMSARTGRCSRRALGYATVLLVWLTPLVAQAQSSCEDNGRSLPILPSPGGGGDPCTAESITQFLAGAWQWAHSPNPPPFASSCWFGPIAGPGEYDPGVFVKVEDDVPSGFRLGINLLAVPSPGDFLCPSPELGGSSICLLPPGAATVGTTWHGVGRPVLDGSVDLVTGLPLIQTTDLELPFDGATFRLTRTRSGNHGGQHSYFPSVEPRPLGSDLWWDWAGTGWMASENPILLIDSALPSAVGDGPRTCWLWLDAHHSIPFQQIESNGKYEAPPRFQARMEHNGQWSVNIQTGLREWAAPPTQYKVFLYGGQLIYTFVSIREDVPPNVWDSNSVNGGDPQWDDSSYHDRPYTANQFNNALGGSEPRSTNFEPFNHTVNPGFGIPHYALCVSIADRTGHEVAIQYCASTRVGMDDAGTTACYECRQNCAGKGQIQYIKLRAGNDVKWTLVYAHRMFRGYHSAFQGGVQQWASVAYPEADFPFVYSQSHGHAAIDRIYVYAGDVVVPSAACLTMSQWNTYGTTGAYSLDAGADPLSVYNANPPAGASPLPTTWKYQVRHHYEYDDTTGRPIAVPILLKTTVRTRVASGAPEVVRTTAYHYSEDPSSYWSEVPWLELVYTDEDIGRVLEAREILGLPPAFGINNLARWRGVDGQPLSSPGEPADTLKTLASKRFDPGFANAMWPAYDTPEAPAAGRLHALGPHGNYITIPNARVNNDGYKKTVGMFSVREPDGEEHHYRVHRLSVLPLPTGIPLLPGEPFHREIIAGNALHSPMRSVFLHPYLWQSYVMVDGLAAGAPREYTDPVDLSQARWVSIIDEFGSREDMVDPSENYGSGVAELGTKRGQLSRRIVEMNATGYILRERKWEYTEDGVVMTGNGLGEEYIYQRVEDYLGAGGLPPPPDPVDPPGVNTPMQLDPYASMRNDLLLIERRSVGWSAAYGAGTGGSEGLVHFYEYRLFGNGTQTPAEEMPWGSRVQLVREGIKRGLNGDKFYTRQIFRDEERPNLVTCQLEWLTPKQFSALPGTPPALVPLTSSTTELEYSATYIVTESVDETGVPKTEARPSGRMLVGAPRQLRAGSDWYYPVEREFYDSKGNNEWSAVGMLRDPLLPIYDINNQLASLNLTYYKRDDYGQTLYTVMDAEPGTKPTPDESSVLVPPWPQVGTATWQRIGQTPAADPPFITSFKYDQGAPGLCDMYTPNERRWSRRVIVVTAPGDLAAPRAEPFAREFVFNDLVPAQGNSITSDGPFNALSAGEIKDYGNLEAEGAPIRTRRVTFGDGSGADVEILSFQQATSPGWEESWRVELKPDANGRLQRAELLEPDSTGAMLAVGSKEFNDLGEVVRERVIDGTITRRTRNAIGQVLRTYVGTDDGDWTTGGPEFNMILTERVEYGLGVNDAWLPTVVRRYDANPESWYREFYDDPPSPDPDGYAAVTSYDWRMRPVRVDAYAKGDPTSAPRLSTALTFLDHADRARWVVTFGAGQLVLPPNLDPVLLADDDPVPTSALGFYQLQLRPISIVELRYGPDSFVTERRTYDMLWAPPGGGGGDPPYQAERQYQGKGGQQVFASRSGQPNEVTRLDGLGRVAQAVTVVPGVGTSTDGYEIARTDYEYDGDGNAIVTNRWTRVIDDSTDALSASNAVRTRSVSWYDVQKRLIASAEMGTEQDGYVSPLGGASVYNRQAHTTAPSWTPGSPPTIDRQGLPGSAQLWIYKFDKSGNQTHVIAPDGSVTEYEYGKLGRIATKTENAYDPQVNLRRKTEYIHQYGRLTSMKPSRTNVQTAPAQVEQTQVTYDAQIVDAEFDVVSAHNGLIGTLRLQGEADPGQLSEVALRLRYNFAGQVAERIDPRGGNGDSTGLAFRYRYDDLGRLKSVEVGHYDWVTPPGGGDPTLEYTVGYPSSMTPPTGVPVNRIGHVEYEYDAAGNVYQVTAREGPPPSGAIVAQDRFEYNVRGQLLKDWQSFAEAVNTSTTPFTGYAWQYQPTGLTAAEPGFTRLTSLTYPIQPASFARTVTLG